MVPRPESIKGVKTAGVVEAVDDEADEEVHAEEPPDDEVRDQEERVFAVRVLLVEREFFRARI